MYLFIICCCCSSSNNNNNGQKPIQNPWDPLVPTRVFRAAGTLTTPGQSEKPTACTVSKVLTQGKEISLFTLSEL